jgi:hypothetical protein
VNIEFREPDSGLRSATPGTFDQSGDYEVGSVFGIQVFFPAAASSIPVPFTLLHDTLPEGLEAFKATSSPVENFPHFGRPTSGSAFVNTEVQIRDNDGK